MAQMRSETRTFEPSWGKTAQASMDLLEADFRGEGWLAGVAIQGLRANPACRVGQASRLRYSRGRGLKLTGAALLISRVWSKGPGPGPGPSLVQWMLEYIQLHCIKPIPPRCGAEMD